MYKIWCFCKYKSVLTALQIYKSVASVAARVSCSKGFEFPNFPSVLYCEWDNMISGVEILIFKLAGIGLSFQFLRALIFTWDL